jgi:general secretion pathway protein M
MTVVAIKGREARIVAIGLVVAIVLIGALGVRHVLADHAARQDRIVALQDRLARYEALAARVPGLEAALETVNADDAIGWVYVDSTNDALASVEVQTALREAAQDAGVTVTAMQRMSDYEEAGVRFVPVQAQMSSTSDALIEMLATLEASTPLLRIESLSTRVRRVRGPASGQGEPTLDTRLTASVLMRSPE